MFRVSTLPTDSTACFPHSRGDVPRRWGRCSSPWQFSPLTWGCSSAWQTFGCAGRVFPTHVGMFRVPSFAACIGSGFPHSRGDVPNMGGMKTQKPKFSPLTWGCSGGVIMLRIVFIVFPTHVGMFLVSATARKPLASFPHSRGDVP